MQRIFVVGFARSGTTLLQSMLTENQALISFKESHFFFRGWLCPFDHLSAWPPWAERFCLPRPEAPLPQLLARFCADNGLPAAPEPAAKASREVWSRQFIAVLDRAAAAQGAAGWLEKTPAHLRRIAHIERLLPDARFVHIVRRFPAVSRSWQTAAASHAHSPFRRTERQLYRRWVRDLARTGYWLARDPQRHHVVTYNGLCNAPQSVIREALEFLQLAPPAEIATHPAEAARWIGSEEPWKQNNLLALRPSSALDRRGEPGRRDLPYEQLVSRWGLQDPV